MKKNLKIVNRSYTRKKYQDEKLRSRDYEFELKLKEALNFYETANYQEALEKLKYLKINNDYFLIHWYLGHTYFKLFEYNLAIQSIKKSIQLKSKDTLNLNFLAKLYKAINDFEYIAMKKEEKGIDNITKIEDCTANQLILIMNKKDILSRTPQLIEHKNKIIAHFVKNKIDGKTLKTMNRKQFGKGIVAELNNKKLKGPLVKLYNNLIQYRFENKKPNLKLSESPLSPSEIGCVSMQC